MWLWFLGGTWGVCLSCCSFIWMSKQVASILLFFYTLEVFQLFYNLWIFCNHARFPPMYWKISFLFLKSFLLYPQQQSGAVRLKYGILVFDVFNPYHNFSNSFVFGCTDWQIDWTRVWRGGGGVKIINLRGQDTLRIAVLKLRHRYSSSAQSCCSTRLRWLAWWWPCSSHSKGTL